MNWYLEVELRRGTMEWSAVREKFVLNFSFESRFPCINTTLHTIQDVVFDMLEKPEKWALPTCDAQMKDIIEFCNVTIEDNEEDPRNNNIPNFKG